MKIVDIANEIYVDSGSPTDTSIAAIAFWIRGKLGTINNLLFESFTYNENTLELNSGNGDLSYEAIAVIKQLYRIYDYEVQIRKHMNALASSAILSIQDHLTTITRINRNSVSQTFAQLRRDEMKILDTLIAAYHSRESTPSQIAGDDTLAGSAAQFPAYPIYLRR